MTEQEQRRGAKHRLAVIRHCEEVTHNVSKTCRYYGISRQCYYRWLERYCDEGGRLRERSRGPKNSPRATKDDVVAKVIYLRQHYHFGPPKDRHVLGPLPRGDDLDLRGVADLEAPGHESVAQLPAS